jgi:hypothetical protein
MNTKKNKNSILIERKCRAPLFGIKNWSEKDIKTPLTFQIDQAVIKIYLLRLPTTGAEVVEKSYQYLLQILFKNAPDDYISGLLYQNKKSQALANVIFDIYTKSYEKFEGLLRDAGKIKDLFIVAPHTLDDFYNGSFLENVTYEINNKHTGIFTPKLPKNRRIWELFKSQQLLTPKRWKDMQVAIKSNCIPEGNTLELLRLWAKASFRDTRIPVIEASIIAEMALKDYAIKILSSKHFSSNKLKDIKDDLTFNSVLNIILPLALTKTESKQMSKYILQVDKLRKIRNKIVHENLESSAIDEKDTKKSIEALVYLMKFIDKKNNR